MYVKTTEVDFIHKCFPNVGQEVEIRKAQLPMMVNSFWDSGQKHTYVFFDLVEGTTFEVKSNHPIFDAGNPSMVSVLPDNVVIVEEHSFHGKRSYTIYASDQNLVKLIKAHSNEEFTFEEKVVLYATRAIISSARVREARIETDISEKDYMSAKESLITKGYLNARGALTLNGKNAAQDLGWNWPKR